MTTIERKVYNKKNREVRIEIYVDMKFFTDKVIATNVNNTENLPIQ